MCADVSLAERRRISIWLIYKRNLSQPDSMWSQQPHSAWRTFKWQILTTPHANISPSNQTPWFDPLTQSQQFDICLQSKASCEVRRPLITSLTGRVWCGMPGHTGVGLKVWLCINQGWKGQFSSPQPRLCESWGGGGGGAAAFNGFSQKRIVWVFFPHVRRKTPQDFPTSPLLPVRKPEEMALSPRLPCP